MRLPQEVAAALSAHADRLDALADEAEKVSPGTWEAVEADEWTDPETGDVLRSGSDDDHPGWEVDGPMPDAADSRRGVVLTAWADNSKDDATDSDAEPVALLVAAVASPDKVRASAAALRLTIEALEQADHAHDHAQDNPMRATCQPCTAAEQIATALGLWPSS